MSWAQKLTALSVFFGMKKDLGSAGDLAAWCLWWRLRRNIPKRWKSLCGLPASFARKSFPDETGYFVFASFTFFSCVSKGWGKETFSHWLQICLLTLVSAFVLLWKKELLPVSANLLSLPQFVLQSLVEVLGWIQDKLCLSECARAVAVFGLKNPPTFESEGVRLFHYAEGEHGLTNVTHRCDFHSGAAKLPSNVFGNGPNCSSLPLWLVITPSEEVKWWFVDSTWGIFSYMALIQFGGQSDKLQSTIYHCYLGQGALWDLQFTKWKCGALFTKSHSCRQWKMIKPTEKHN